MTPKAASARRSATPRAISAAADATRKPRLDQSNRLAGGEDVIGYDCAIAPVTPGVGVERRLEVLLAVVGPEHVLEDELSVGRLPQQEVGQPLLAGRPHD